MKNNNNKGTTKLGRFFTLLMAGAIMSPMGLFFACKEDIEPDPEPKKPVYKSTTYNFRTAAELVDKAWEINDKIEKNTPIVKDTLIVKFMDNMGITNAQKSTLDNLPNWSKAAMQGRSIALDINGKFVYPTEKIFLTVDDLKWMKIMSIRANPNTGMLFVIEPANMEAFKEYSDFVQVNHEGGGDNDIVCTSVANLVSDIDKVMKAVDEGKKAKFVLAGMFNLDNTHTTALNKILNSKGKYFKDIEFDTDNAIIQPADKAINIEYPNEFRYIFKNITKSQYNSGKYWYVAGAAFDDVADKRGFTAQVGVAQTDTLNASGGNLEHYWVPETWTVDKDLYDCSNINADLSKYKGGNIEIVSKEASNPNVPGGKNRTLLLHPELFSTPTSEKAGEPRRTMYSKTDIVLDMYFEGRKFWTDAASGDYVTVKDPFKWTYDCEHRNYYVNKKHASTKIANEWAKKNGKEELFPTYAQMEGQRYTCTVTFPDYCDIWDLPSSIYGMNPNMLKLVGSATLQKILKEVFGGTAAGSNGWFYVRFYETNPVLPTDDFDAAKTAPEPYTALMQYLDKSGIMLNYEGVAFSEELMKLCNKKAWKWNTSYSK
jgi:hypothetical protein